MNSIRILITSFVLLPTSLVMFGFSLLFYDLAKDSKEWGWEMLYYSHILLTLAILLVAIPLLVGSITGLIVSIIEIMV